MFVSVRAYRTVRGLPSDLATCWTAGIQFPTGARDLSPLHSVQSGAEAHPASYPMGTGCSIPEDKASGREANYSPPSSAQVKDSVVVPPLTICHLGVTLN
jgi:hypothetical protein